MAHRNVSVSINRDIVPTKPDCLMTDCLRIEAVAKVMISPTEPGRINLAIHNSSSDGRIAHLKASYDPKLVKVTIADPQVYVAPGGKTITYAIISSNNISCNTLVSFEVE